MALENIAMNVSEINYVISVSADACHDASLSCVNLVVFRTFYYYVPGWPDLVSGHGNVCICYRY